MQYKFHKVPNANDLAIPLQSKANPCPFGSIPKGVNADLSEVKVCISSLFAIRSLVSDRLLLKPLDNKFID